MSPGGNLRSPSLIFTIIRLSVLAIGLISVVIFCIKKNIIDENTLSSLSFIVSLVTTALFTGWINITITFDNRYSKKQLTTIKGHWSLCYLLIFAYTILFSTIMSFNISYNFFSIKSVFWLSLCGTIALVFLVAYFDKKILSMEAIIENIANNDITTELNEDNQKARNAAHAIFYYLDIPILIGVSLTTIFCLIMHFTKINPSGFVSGFSAGATGMQIIIANVAFEFIYYDSLK